MDEHKSMSLAVLGVVVVIAVVSVVLLLSNTDQTGLVVRGGAYYNGDGLVLGNTAPKMYGGAARGNSYPCRLVSGHSDTCQAEAVTGGIPARTYWKTSAWIPSLQTACDPQFEVPKDFNNVGGYEDRWSVQCRRLAGHDGLWCCPQVDQGQGEVKAQ